MGESLFLVCYSGLDQSRLKIVRCYGARVYAANIYLYIMGSTEWGFAISGLKFHIGFCGFHMYYICYTLYTQSYIIC